MLLNAHLGSLLLALSIAPLSAQAPPQSDSNQMTLHVSVSTRSGDTVEGLTKDDFSLFDNKHEEPITGLQAITPKQTGIVIVLDAVNMPYNEVSFARQQLSQFLGSNGGHLAQPTTLGVLEDQGLQIQPGFTTDGNALRASLDHLSIGLREVTRSTGVYGAEERLQISVKNFESLITQLPRTSPMRIIWVSPGWPLLGGPEIELNPSQRAPIFNDVVAINTELRRSRFIVDAINPIGATEDIGRTNYYESFLRAPRSPRDIELGQIGLQVIALQSGGLVVNGSNDIAGLIQRSVAQTKGGYDLTFTPAPGEHDNEYHELQVKVRRPGVTVHTTAGYYARPVYGAPQSVSAPSVR